ncbi:flavodoxin domain-containing protein [Microbacteriaceae bacterium VKM Ac-2854]|nr:flavodoxin domain-containing protein [Microbacteriaceae bacterium VKM Ac-2854]
MRALVVYESMFGNTRHVAEAIRDGLADTLAVTLRNVTDAAANSLDDLDLLLLGGPTHVHGMSLQRSRAEAPKWAADPEHDLRLDEHAGDAGVREWLAALSHGNTMAAAFDTRTDIPRILSGTASARIDHELRRHGLRSIAAPMSFLVDTDNHLEVGELARARAWGGLVAQAALATGT